jgi:hypothetical protein
MPCKCVECGGKIDCDSIICTECLSEIIDKVNTRSYGDGNTVRSENKVEVKHG